MKLKEIRKNTAFMLSKAGIIPCEFETDVLIETVLNVDRTGLITKLEDCITDEQIQKISELSKKRAQGYPLQYIVGKWEFYGMEFFVGEGVLIPRADTETVIDAAKKLCFDCHPIEAIDLCSGSGCIAIALEKQLDAKVYALEKSERAYSYLTDNIKLHKSKVTPMQRDVLDKTAMRDLPQADLIVSNPPYIKSEDIKNLSAEISFEPEMALDGDIDGLKFYRGITALWKDKLKCGGYLLYEIGSTQEKDVGKILFENGFSDITVVSDICKNPRVIYGRKL